MKTWTVIEHVEEITVRAYRYQVEADDEETAIDLAVEGRAGIGQLWDDNARNAAEPDIGMTRYGAAEGTDDDAAGEANALAFDDDWG